MNSDVRFLRYLDEGQEKFIAVDLITAAECDHCDGTVTVTVGSAEGNCTDIVISGEDAERALDHLRWRSTYDVGAQLTDKIRANGGKMPPSIFDDVPEVERA